MSDGTRQVSVNQFSAAIRDGSTLDQSTDS
jgi:hypothetical protein